MLVKEFSLFSPKTGRLAKLIIEDGDHAGRNLLQKLYHSRHLYGGGCQPVTPYDNRWTAWALEDLATFSIME